MNALPRAPPPRVPPPSALEAPTSARRIPAGAAGTATIFATSPNIRFPSVSGYHAR
jgi:hypothetical protein